MQQDLISVVIPVYKVENVLRECLDSVVNQTWKNLEIILVDDGSPDGCGKICDEYAKKDRRIRVIHQENRGLSAARNRGLEQAAGEYVAFVDSDDVLHREFYHLMMQALTYTDSDMSVCNMMRLERSEVQEKFVSQRIQNPRARAVSVKEACGWFYQEEYKDRTALHAANKLYKKKLFGEHIRYPEGKIHEDIATTYQLFCASEKIAYIDLELYCYIKTPGSITAQKFALKNLTGLDAWREMRNYFRKDRQFFEAYQVEKCYLLQILDHYVKLRNDCPQETEVLNKMMQEFRHDYKKYKNSMKLTEKEKLRYQCVYYFPEIWYYSIKLRAHR